MKKKAFDVLFAVAGAEKALSYGHNVEVAVLLGTTTAVGGGVLRDVLLNRVPITLKRGIYASAALIGASIVVVANYLKWIPKHWTSIVGLAVCFVLKMLSIHYHWNLPVPANGKTRPDK